MKTRRMVYHFCIPFEATASVPFEHVTCVERGALEATPAFPWPVPGKVYDLAQVRLNG